MVNFITLLIQIVLSFFIDELNYSIKTQKTYNVHSKVLVLSEQTTLYPYFLINSS